MRTPRARTLLAVGGGTTFLILWMAAAVILADGVMRMNMAVQLAYFAVAGLAWVAPIAWLMAWSARAS